MSISTSLRLLGLPPTIEPTKRKHFRRRVLTLQNRLKPSQHLWMGCGHITLFPRVIYKVIQFRLGDTLLQLLANGLPTPRPDRLLATVPLKFSIEELALGRLQFLNFDVLETNLCRGIAMNLESNHASLR